MRESTGTSSPHPAFLDDGGESEVQNFLDEMAEGLTRGDAAAVAKLWEAPAFVLGDDEVHAVASQEAVRQFFAGARDQYNQMGVTDTHAEIQMLDWLTDRIALVEVRWPWLDGRGREIGGETSTYVLRRDDRGNLRLRTAIMHGAEDAH